MMNRRNFLKASTGATLGGIVLLNAGCGDSPESSAGQMNDSTAVVGGSRTLSNIGVQLYTLRSLMQDDFEGTLEKVAGIGYDQVEFAGYYDRTPEQVRQLLDQLGLAAVSTHIGYDQVRENLSSVMEASKTLGLKYIVVPALPEAARASIDSYKEVAEVLNTAGAQCRQEGLALAYHNHAFEFEEADGQIPYDVLLAQTDPDLVKMELDLFWIAKAGKDPIAYFSQYGDRFRLCHVKDMTPGGDMAPVGSGKTDFAAIFDRAEQIGMEYYIVEHDNPEDPIQSIQTSYDYLKAMTY